jgi:2-polyprenyl-6-methoxyphenol hydroxylase-like FAD-dependent oxidoreductase
LGLVSSTDEGELVIARLRGPAGQDETCEANYIAGCDGAHSTVRDTVGTGFPGGTLRSMASCTSISTRPISWA